MIKLLKYDKTLGYLNLLLIKSFNQWVLFMKMLLYLICYLKTEKANIHIYYKSYSHKKKLNVSKSFLSTFV